MAELGEEEAELPTGWESRFTSDGRMYYINHNDQSTQWHHPRNGSVKTVTGELPFGWHKDFDEDGYAFFVDSVSGKISYVNPRIVLAAKPKSKGKVKIDTSKTALEVLKDKNLTGKVVIVTGANSGIGFQTTKALSLYGAHVIMACRDIKKANLAADEIRCVRKTLIPELTVLHLDLASLQGIEQFAEKFKSLNIPLHILICNAAVLTPSRDQTEDGIERTFGVNHVGHFYLVKLLQDCLCASAPARVVVVASESHRFPNFDYSAQLNLHDLPLKKENYWSILAYNQSKLCNILFSIELNRRLSSCGVTSNAVHPGNMIYTSLAKNSWFYWFVYLFCRPFSKSASQGAAGVVHCATSSEVDNAGGYYFNNFYAIEPSYEASNSDKALGLWKFTEQLINEKKRPYNYDVC